MQKYYTLGIKLKSLGVIVLLLSAVLMANTNADANVNTNANVAQASETTIITLKEGATIEGVVLNVSPDFLTIHTSKGQLVIPIKSLNDQSRAIMEKKIEGLLKQKKEEPPKANPRLISTIFEQKEREAQKAEGEGIRVKFGRKDFVYRRYSERDQKREFLFTPVGETQIFDSEESIKIIYNEEITSIEQAFAEAEKQSASLGDGGSVMPPSRFERGTRDMMEKQVTFAGIVEGENGNPNRVVYGKVIKDPKGKFMTLIYTYFSREKTMRETQAWFGRNFERIGIIMDSLENLPTKQELEETDKQRLTDNISQQ